MILRHTLYHNQKLHGAINNYQGTNMLAGNDSKEILKITRKILKRGKRQKRITKYWDGKAASRIVAVLNRKIP